MDIFLWKSIPISVMMMKLLLLARLLTEAGDWSVSQSVGRSMGYSAVVVPFEEWVYLMLVQDIQRSTTSPSLPAFTRRATCNLFLVYLSLSDPIHPHSLLPAVKPNRIARLLSMHFHSPARNSLHNQNGPRPTSPQRLNLK